MPKIKKVLLIRIIGLIVIADFIFTYCAYSLIASSSNTLRIPLVNSDTIGIKRQEDLEKEAFLKAKGPLRDKILNEAEEQEVISKLSSDNNAEIDETLPILRTLQNPEQIVRIIEKVYANRGLRLEVFEKETSKELPNIRIIRISNNEIAGRIPFFPSVHKLLEFYSIVMSDENIQRKRLFPLLSYWVIAHPYFQSRCAGWSIIEDKANVRAVRAFWQSGFDNIKISKISTNEEISDIKQLEEDELYVMTAKFPVLKSAKQFDGIIFEVDNKDDALIKKMLAKDWEEGFDVSTAKDELDSIQKSIRKTIFKSIQAGTTKLIAVMDKETNGITGYASYGEDNDPELPGGIYISRIFIHPDYRQRGISKLLLSFLQGKFNCLRLENVPDTDLDARKYSEIFNGMRNLYLEVGFIQRDDRSFVWIKPTGHLQKPETIESSL